MSTPILSTGRLVLRPFGYSDLSAVYDLCSRPESSRYSLWQPHRNYWDSLKYIFFVKHRSIGRHWVAVAKSGDKYIGSGSFVRLDEEKGEAELGYTVHPDYWRRGYGSEIASALMFYAFKKLGLARVYVRIMRENVASVALAEKLGMRRVETDRNYVMDGDVRREIIVMELTAAEYDKITCKN